MNESKFKRLVVAITAGAVMLLIFLLIIMIYQLIAISAERAEERELRAVVEQYMALTKEQQKTLDARTSRQWIERRARELGYVYKDDVGLVSSE